MTAQPPEVPQWQEWCLEHTCTMLQCSFPAAAVWIVRPSWMLRQMFSCFHNFVQSSLIGVPTYNTTYGCLLQLEALLKDAIQNAIRKGHLDMSSTQGNFLVEDETVLHAQHSLYGRGGPGQRRRIYRRTDQELWWEDSRWSWWRRGVKVVPHITMT